MRQTIETTERKAILAARKELAAECGVSKLNSPIHIKGASVQCCCGQTYAVSVWSLKYQKEVCVGVCKHCSNN